MEVYFRKTYEADAEWLEFMEMLAQQTAIAINNAELLNSLQISNNGPQKYLRYHVAGLGGSAGSAR